MKRLVLIVLLPFLLGADKCPIPWPTPSPSPTATPSPTPTPEPTSTPTPTPTPTPVPTPTPSPTPSPTPTPGSACPKPLAAGAYVYINVKFAGHGIDSTPRVHGDPAFCKLVGGVGNDCHLDGMPSKVQKVACEVELMDGCPVWQYSPKNATGAFVCHDDQNALASCDHMGTQPAQDDPKTKTTGDTLDTLKGFEGKPAVCGLQRDQFGPIAGYFTVAHGDAYLRACAPNDTAHAHCSAFVHFNH